MDPQRPPLRPAPGLVFDPPLLLAPMEGVTDPAFRGLVADSNAPGSLGGACTEFLRVTGHPMPAARILAAWPGPDPRLPVGVQFMGNDPACLARSAATAAELGAPFVDLNFGCPAPRVFQHRAGCALLEDPPLLERLVREVVHACPVPVTAKIRAGVRDDRGLEEVARRIEDAGAVLLTVHARLRIQGYGETADWSRIRRAVRAVSIPVVGNGGATTPAAIEALFEETGCAGVMVGRGALGRPWIFEDWARLRAGRPPRPPEPERAVRWLRRYTERMLEGGARPLQALGRAKQSLRAMDEAGTLEAGPRLHGLLRLQELEAFLDALEELASPGASLRH